MARKHDEFTFLDVLYRVCDALCEGESREFTRDNGVTLFRRDKDNVFFVEGPFVAVSLSLPIVRVSMNGIADQDGKPLEVDKDDIAGLTGRLINLDYEMVQAKALPAA
ncbi:hypothetical protein U5801_24235 [Lamprobacter modestohalophilus]|uniref:hypothetical protein n=1 Tax=Lamprobacter modestohalophilus TaxID=1064514 RepID=UPI002ADEE0FC|nr:hypothetical protein [Lamprobacter modestohalophilus]MEA1052891.1 hypothetical protein [Lamprobacter modestohalophilus]